MYKSPCAVLVSNSDKIKMQKKTVLLLLVLLFSQVLAKTAAKTSIKSKSTSTGSSSSTSVGDLNTNFGSASACTKTQSDGGISTESLLYGYSSLVAGALAIIPGAELFGGALALVNTIWVRKNNKH